MVRRVRWTAFADVLLHGLAGGDGDGADAEARSARRREASAALQEALDAERPLLWSLVESAGLAAEEVEVLALCAAVEVDEQRQALVARLQGEDVRRPTLGLLARLFDPAHPGPLAVAEGSRLRRAALVEVPGVGPWAARPVVVASQVVWALAGDTSLDPELPAGATVVPGAPDGPDPDGPSHLLVVGEDRTRRREAAGARLARSHLLCTPLPSTRAEWDAVVREATLSALAVVLELEPPEGVHELPPVARRAVERADHLPWCLASAHELPLDNLPEGRWAEVRAEPATASSDEVAGALGDRSDHGHRLGAEQLRLLGRLADPGPVDAAARRLAAGPLERSARRIQPRRRWDHLVLRPGQERQLRELVARYRHRATVHGEWGVPAVPSSGLIALFSGPSGTGKTTAAEVVAGELGLDLFVVDLSSVLSKYIGETEQNLDAAFEAATAGNVVLLFDEADALFGQRSDVSDARDRYANVEVSYLLQRIERWDGFAVLTTNLRQHLDQAFLRRIHVAVEFPSPDESERRRIWSVALDGLPLAVADGDVEDLAARFDLTGGSIRNAALTAAFLAADAGGEVTTPLLVRGVSRELEKLGRLRNEDDFGPWFPYAE
ncbi:MAG: ATP-binding protein [Acidimicrobiia bacterium]